MQYIYIYVIYIYICIYMFMHCKIKKDNHQVPKIIMLPGNKRTLRK